MVSGNYNVHTIALEIPISRLTRTVRVTVVAPRIRRRVDRRVVDRQPSGDDDENTSATRYRARRLRAGVRCSAVPLGQRSGDPRLALKDTFNGLEPTGDGAALGFVIEPDGAAAARGVVRS